MPTDGVDCLFIGSLDTKGKVVVMADDEWEVERAQAVLADFDKWDGLRSAIHPTWGAAVFAPILAVISLIQAIPPTARLLLHTNNSGPSALLGTVFFGLISWVAIKRVIRMKAARRYLRARGLL